MEDREEEYMLVFLVQIMFFFLEKTKEVPVNDFSHTNCCVRNG